MGDDCPVVLVVEDDPDLADLFADYLDDVYAVRTACSGEEAMRYLDNSIDVTLLDRNLGEWQGEELVTVIHDRQIECQIAMVTAMKPDFDIINLPISDYITKPVSRRGLRQTVDELLRWTEQDVTTQELLALISRKIALERQKLPAELRANREYLKLQRRIDLIKERLELGSTAVKEASSKYRPKACGQCDLRWDLSVKDTVGFVRLGTHVWKCLRCGSVEFYAGPSERRVARR